MTRTEPALDPAALATRLAERADLARSRGTRVELVLARLADRLRDIGLAPFAPEAFPFVTFRLTMFDLALLDAVVLELESPATLRAFAAGSAGRDPAELVRSRLVAPIRSFPGLDLRDLVHHPVRGREFAEALAVALAA